MPAGADRFAPFAARMQAEGLPEIVIQTFKHYYQELVAGRTGFISEADIQPIASLPRAETLPERLAGVGGAALAKTILLKLNGGLGTSMGLERAKSLLVVKNGLSFLDIIARQALQTGVPLVLMNSFSTRADSLAALEKYPGLTGTSPRSPRRGKGKSDLPLDFLQHKAPKVARPDLSPVAWPQQPELEWAPPGHGDIYTALVTSSLLERLLQAGYEYAFVSNADNLGAVMDTAILGYFVENHLPFMMEVADRTEADKKGGHLAGCDGRFVLRESAQCPAGEIEAFQDISRHKYFNTNNLWLNLPALQAVMTARDNILGLAMIRNAKTVDPRDPASTPVYQLETAMGAAITIFEGAQAIRVPRRRFAPVKTTNDLLAIRSDAYILTDDFRVAPNPARSLGPPVITLDPTYYKLIDDLEARFPHGAPSLLACKQLDIQGDFKFGPGVHLKGVVRLVNKSGPQVEIEAGAVIEGE